MSIILDLFRQKTSFQKALLSSSILNETAETVDVNDIKLMLQGFPNPHENEQLVQSMTILQIFKEFIRFVPNKAAPIVKLKVIITCNLLLGDQKYGRLLAPQFSLWGGWKNEYKESAVKSKISQKDVLVKFIHSYQGVLQKLTINHDILLKSRSQTGSNTLYKNLPQTLTIFYKVVNMLNYVFALKDLFELAAATQNQVAVMEAYLLVWNDIITLYLYFERFILQFLDTYQHLDGKESLQVYELLRDFLLCSDKIRAFYAINKKYQQKSNLKEPRWNIIDKNILEEVYLYFQNVRIHATSRDTRDKDSSIVVPRAHLTDRDTRKNGMFSEPRKNGFLSEPEPMNILTTKPTQFSNAIQYTFETDQQQV